VFRWGVRVYYEDTDSGGVVYYANYLRFMERARTEWMRSLGFEQDRLLAEQGLLFAVRSASIDYLQPARFNDLLDVTVDIRHCGRASLTLEQAVLRHAGAASPLCTGTIRIACIEAQTFRPQPIPDSILKEIVDVD
jgi:acyl-CoA thioester hydrolase